MKVVRHAVCTLLLCTIASSVQAQQPRTLWNFSAQSNLYAPPLVADVHSSPGKEIIISDSEVRCLRCISAQGAELWQAQAGWKKRLISAAALSAVTNKGLRLLAVGNADGSLVCLDAATGVVRWRANAGAVEWGGGLWTDLDHDDKEEFVLATHRQGIAAFEADGQEIWRYQNADQTAAMEIPCVPAAADIDGDGTSELFFATPQGVFCLHHDGALRWRLTTGDDFTASCVLTAEGLYTLSREEHHLWRIDSKTGAVQWKRALAAGADVYNGSAMAAGDINGDGKAELVCADRDGHIYAYTTDGVLLWMFTTRMPVPAAITLGDVDGDGLVDVLAASGDHNLYCLDRFGREQWRFAAGLRLVGPATIDDIDADGKTDLLVCGSDRTLRCLTLAGRYDPALTPWPSRRFDTAQSGSNAAFHPVLRSIKCKRSLFAFGGFDKKRETAHMDSMVKRMMHRPRGWRCETPDATWGLYESIQQGQRTSCLQTDGRCIIVSDHISLPAGLQSVEVKVDYSGKGSASAELRWIGDAGITGITPLRLATKKEGWNSFTAEEAPPQNARFAQMVLASGNGKSSWKNVRIDGTLREPVRITVLINQAGYDIGCPKHFVVQSNLNAGQASFELVDQNGCTVLQSPLQNKGRIAGRYGQDWGSVYYEGKFTDYDQPGKCRIRAHLDGATSESWPFEIGYDMIWNATARPAYRFFWYQRCGMAIPGMHDACHLDDSVGPDGKTSRDVHGGWHDAGDYNKYQNAPYVIGLARAYTAAPSRFDAVKPSEEESFLDEILWGGEHVRRMITEDGSSFGAITSGYGFWGPPELETDNLPATGDERPASSTSGVYPGDHQAALARIAALLREKGLQAGEWVATADRCLSYSLKMNHRGLNELSAAVDLFRATGDKKYSGLAKELFSALAQKTDLQPSAMLVDIVQRYDAAFNEDHSSFLKGLLVPKAEALLALADNPFGVCTFGPLENPNFFNTPADKGGWHVGTSSYLMESANLVALAYHYDPQPEYLEFIYDQFNWTLGMNPYDVCLMEGVGSFNLPSYHHRITFAGVARGAIPGSVVNGVTWMAVGDDRPFVDLSGQDIPAFEPNECWLPHNTAYLNALANLMAAKAE